MLEEELLFGGACLLLLTIADLTIAFAGTGRERMSCAPYKVWSNTLHAVA